MPLTAFITSDFVFLFLGISEGPLRGSISCIFGVHMAMVGSREGCRVLHICFPSWKVQGQCWSEEGSAPGLVTGSCLVLPWVSTVMRCSLVGRQDPHTGLSASAVLDLQLS